MKSRRLRGPASLLTTLWLLLAPGLPAQEEAPSRPEPAPAPAPVEPRLGALYRYDIKVFARGPEGKLETEPLALHFPGRAVPAPADEAWHRTQLDGMIEAELDFAAVLFAGRGAAGHGEDGLRALVAARTGIAELGGEPPLLALVIDTERLFAPGVDETGRDLDPAHVAARLAAVTREFLAIVPPEARLRLDDFEVVFVGPSFGVPHARDVFESLDGRGSKAAAGEERTKIFFVAERSWQARRPATYDADAALMGPRGDTVVRFLGPGYDDSQIPGRGNPLRHREDTRFFAWSFDRVLLAAPTLVVIDSWNDFRQGTGIAPSEEYGKAYVEVTRRYKKRLTGRVVPDPSRPVRLAYPDPVPRPDTGWYTSSPERNEVSFTSDGRGGLLGEGLRVARVPDGPFRFSRVLESPAVTSLGPGVRYLYFGVADEFASRVAGPFEIELDCVDAGGAEIALQYDAWDRSGTLDGRYKKAPAHRCGELPRRRRLVWTLPDARFSNRQNGGCDFRFSVRGADLEVLGVKVRRLEKTELERPSLRVED